MYCTLVGKHLEVSMLLKKKKTEGIAVIFHKIVVNFVFEIVIMFEYSLGFLAPHPGCWLVTYRNIFFWFGNFNLNLWGCHEAASWVLKGEVQGCPTSNLSSLTFQPTTPKTCPGFLCETLKGPPGRKIGSSNVFSLGETRSVGLGMLLESWWKIQIFPASYVRLLKGKLFVRVLGRVWHMTTLPSISH